VTSSPVKLHLCQDAAADSLLSRDPLALLIGMLLDQQVPMEKAFRGPAVLLERLGAGADASLDAEAVAGHPDLAGLFAQVPAIHRFPRSMADRVAALCAYLVEHHDGRAAAVWESADTGRELLRRLTALPGFGDQKARIFVALLGKQLGVRPPGWREAAGSYGDDGARRSIADVTDPASLLEVRAFKQESKRQAKERPAGAAR
jgi:uncharacterized HhH-GPD family protein